jgi:hypothetical protein
MGVLIEGSKVGFLDRHDSSLHCQNPAGSRAENCKTLALGGISEITVQSYQFQVSGITFSSNQSRAELERVSGAQRVRLNQSLGVTAD